MPSTFRSTSQPSRSGGWPIAAIELWPALTTACSSAGACRIASRARPRSPCRCRRDRSTRSRRRAGRDPAAPAAPSRSRRSAAPSRSRLAEGVRPLDLRRLPHPHQRTDRDVEAAARATRYFHRLVQYVVERRIDVDQNSASAPHQLGQVALGIEMAQHVIQAHDLGERRFDRAFCLCPRRVIRRDVEHRTHRVALGMDEDRAVGARTDGGGADNREHDDDGKDGVNVAHRRRRGRWRDRPLLPRRSASSSRSRQGWRATVPCRSGSRTLVSCRRRTGCRRTRRRRAVEP